MVENTHMVIFIIARRPSKEKEVWESLVVKVATLF